MDLKVYYQKIRQIESRILDAVAIIVSLETADGGKAGRLAEVSPAIAAKIIVEGTGRLASAEEAEAYRQRRAATDGVPEANGNTVRETKGRPEDPDRKAATRNPRS